MTQLDDLVLLLVVFIGGGIGAVLRWSISTAVLKKFHRIFPVGTFIINISGSFLIGVISTLVLYDNYQLLNLFLITGLLGGYTTFSTYELETAQLFKKNKPAAIAYWLGSVAAGIIAACAGVFLAGGFA